MAHFASYIGQEHRLIYKVESDELLILSARGYYGDKANLYTVAFRETDFLSFSGDWII